MDHTYDSMFYHEGEFIGGLDESGVSDIAGPLVAACVILPKIDIHKHDLKILEINDSKQIPEKYRKQHAETVWKVATAIGIGEVSPTEIDYLGKYAAIRLAMLRAIAACKKTGTHKQLTPDYLLIDGELLIPTPIRNKVIKKGDAKSLSIAAASIVAKVYRDDIMLKLHSEYPEYDWASNKGYPCENQFVGIDKIGIQMGIHRTKFWPFTENPKLNANEKELWRKRRHHWRAVTEGKLFTDLGGLEWTSKSKLTKHLTNLKDLQEKVQPILSERVSKVKPTSTSCS
jgi:ribonuclease HII